MYPKEVLAAAVCNVKIHTTYAEWEQKCTLKSLHVDLPFLSKQHVIYWYPEQDPVINALLLHSLDPSHLLTNLRTAITQKGDVGITPDDYKLVCKEKVLQMVTIHDNLDQQNVSIAREVFSQKVEDCLKGHGRMDTGNAVSVIRRWYEACDDRGLPAQ